MIATSTIPPAGKASIAMPADTRDRYLSATRHSQRVLWLKIALPVLAVVAVLGFGSYSWLKTIGLPTLDLANASIEDGKLVMANPKIDGFNNDNQPYNLRALKAIQELGKNHLVDLQAVDARMPLGPNRYADIKSPTGSFDNVGYTMTFNSPMSVITNDGTSATLADARVELNSGNMVTKGVVDITMSGSHISAEGLTVTERGKTLVFERKVRVTVDPRSINLAQNATGDTHADSQ